MSQIDDAARNENPLPANGRADGDGKAVHSLSTPQLRRCYEAFLRDLPSLLGQYAGQWVAYAGDQKLSIGPSKRNLYRQCIAAGHSSGDFLICGIEKPQQVLLDDLLDV